MSVKRPNEMVKMVIGTKWSHVLKKDGVLRALMLATLSSLTWLGGPISTVGRRGTREQVWRRRCHGAAL